MILEQVYQENLEERLIAYLAEKDNLSLETAMNTYYHSRLAQKINQGTEGIQYLDHKVLVEILHETEPELFPEKTPAIDLAVSEIANQ